MEGQHMPLGLWVFLAAWVYVIQPVGGWLLDHPTVAALLLLAWWLAAVLDRLRTAVEDLKTTVDLQKDDELHSDRYLDDLKTAVEELTETVHEMKNAMDQRAGGGT